MPWYILVLAICLIVAPFDALYMYIKAGRRRDALRRKEREDKGGAAGQTEKESDPD